jgi:hypothetical protein
VTFWNLDALLQLTLDDLFERGCDWVRGYLQTNPNVTDRALCDDRADTLRMSESIPAPTAPAPASAAR